MTYRSESGSIRILLAGDVMPARRLTPFEEPDYRGLIDLVRGADVAFANLETTVRDPEEGAPNFTQGTPMSTSPVLLDDLRWMGFDLLSCANNHATDYGVGGVEAMVRHLSRRNIPFAGAGDTLAQARRPGYADSAAGRVGLVAATSFFRPWNRAADQRPDAAGRPGINPLGFETSYTVDEQSMAALMRVSEQLGLSQERVRHRAMFYSSREAPLDSAESLSFLGSTFRKGDGFSVSTKVSRGDAEENLRWIKEARRQCDWLVFSFHSHEFGSAGRLEATTDIGLDDPSEFGVAFAHAAIDAGADIVAGHGPHLTLGAEIYKGRPIFYSLGNFIFQNDNVPVFPAEAYGRFDLDHLATPSDFLDARTGNETRGFPASPEFWQSFVAVAEFTGWKLSSVRLHPVDLGYGLSRAQRGRPVLARGDVAMSILGRLQRLSAKLGTGLTLDGETALLTLG